MSWTDYIVPFHLKVMLIFCLVMLVKILKSVVKDRLADFFKDLLNSDLPYVPWLTM